MAETSYTHNLSPSQAQKLQSLLEERGWTFVEKEYAIFSAKREKLNVTVYEKGPKVLVQGRGTTEFVEFTLEPEILGVAEQGYEDVHNPDMFQPHLGIDESGKGDFFGPLVIAGAYVDPHIARDLLSIGVQDSKAISSDKKIRDLGAMIREVPNIAVDVVSIGPVRYNEVYKSAGNLNKLLAWGHSRVIENLLELRPQCPRALSDQFAHESVLKKALLPKGKQILLQQRTKGESDVAVAAASILARERFINWLDEGGARLGVQFPRGCSSKDVEILGKKLVQQHGIEFLPKIGKMHFRNSYRILGLPEPERVPFRRGR